MLTKNNVIQHIVTLDSNESAFNTAATVLIIFGVVILMFAAFGFFFVCLPKRCSGGKQLFGGLYIIFLSLVLIGELGGEIAAAVFKGKLDDQLPDILKKSLGSNYKEGNNLQAKAWDFVQVLLTCCGSKGPQDYYGTSFNNTNRHVPDTCCVLTNKDPEHPNVKNYFECQFEAYQIQHNVTSNSSDFIHKEGCFTSFESQINGHLAQLVGIGVAIVMLELLGIVLACYVCRKGDDNDPDNDKRSKARSHNRNLTPYTRRNGNLNNGEGVDNKTNSGPSNANYPDNDKRYKVRFHNGNRTPYTRLNGDLNYGGGVDNETNSDASNAPYVVGPDDGNPDGDGLDVGNPDGDGPDVGNPDDDGPDVGNPDGDGQDVGYPDGDGPDVGNPDGDGPDVGNPDGDGPDVGNPDGDGPDVGNPDGDGPDVGNPDGDGPDVGNPDDVCQVVTNPWYGMPSFVPFDQTHDDRILREMPSSLRDELNTLCSRIGNNFVYKKDVDDVMMEMPSFVRDKLKKLCYQLHIDVSEKKACDCLIRQTLLSVHKENNEKNL
ncbi:uncharacterized protein LOC127839051 [Dreissena polymorpha]|nr:uncharacterized protein LOC127839051 [Dreissena polymorpha]